MEQQQHDLSDEKELTDEQVMPETTQSVAPLPAKPRPKSAVLKSTLNLAQFAPSEKKVGPWDAAKSPRTSPKSPREGKALSATREGDSTKLTEKKKMNAKTFGKFSSLEQSRLLRLGSLSEARRLEPLSMPAVTLLGSALDEVQSARKHPTPVFGHANWTPSTGGSGRRKLTAVLQHRGSERSKVEKAQRLGLGLRGAPSSSVTVAKPSAYFASKPASLGDATEEKGDLAEALDDDTEKSESESIGTSRQDDDGVDKEWAQGMTKQQLVRRVERLYEYSQELLGKQGERQENLAMKLFSFEEENFMLQSQQEQLKQRMKETENYSNMVEKQYGRLLFNFARLGRIPKH